MKSPGKHKPGDLLKDNELVAPDGMIRVTKSRGSHDSNILVGDFKTRAMAIKRVNDENDMCEDERGLTHYAYDDKGKCIA